MKKNLNRLTAKYLWGKVKKYKFSLMGTLCLYGLAVIFQDILTGLQFKEFFDLLANIGSQKKAIVFEGLFKILVIITGLYCLGNVCWRLGEFFHIRIELESKKDIAHEVFQKIHTQSYNFFANRFTGSLVSQANRLLRGHEAIVDALVFQIFLSVVTVIFSAWVLYSIAPILGIYLLAWVILFVIAVWSVSIWQMKYNVQNAAADSKLTGKLTDTIINAITIKMFSRSKYEKWKFGKVIDEKKKIECFCWLLDNAVRFCKDILMVLLEIGMLYFSITLWMEGKITAGTIILAHIYMSRILHSIRDFNRTVRNVHIAFADSKEMIEVMHMKPDIKDPKNPKKAVISRGGIEFKNLSFRYPETKKDVLKHFNLKIKAGEKVGLVGESGAGKTTLTKLLFRFVEATKGKLLIDGQNIADMAQEDLRSHIAFVPQEPILFHRTLLENIQYGNLDADQAYVEGVAKKARAHAFIQKTPQGYKTLVGERGVKLSGGEKQRIAIARAMLKNAPILVLDEATSSLDSESETYIQEALQELMKGRTTIVIAHRLSTIQKMDRIIVMDQGKIVEQGSHKELLVQNGKYADLWKHQSGGFLV